MSSKRKWMFWPDWAVVWALFASSEDACAFMSPELCPMNEMLTFHFSVPAVVMRTATPTVARTATPTDTVVVVTVVVMAGVTAEAATVVEAPVVTVCPTWVMA